MVETVSLAKGHPATAQQPVCGNHPARKPFRASQHRGARERAPTHGLLRRTKCSDKKTSGRARVPSRKCATAKTAEIRKSLFVRRAQTHGKNAAQRSGDCSIKPSRDPRTLQKDYNTPARAVSMNASVNSSKIVNSLTLMIASSYVTTSALDDSLLPQVPLPPKLGLQGEFRDFFHIIVRAI